MPNKKWDKMVTIVPDVPVEDTRVTVLTVVAVGLVAVVVDDDDDNHARQRRSVTSATELNCQYRTQYS